MVRSPSTRAAVLALALGVAGFAAVEAQPQAALDARVVAAVDRLYPGFEEILERDDPTGLVVLAHTLTRNPSVEALTVLFWMLERCPSWNSQEFGLEIRRAVQAAGGLPGAARLLDAVRAAGGRWVFLTTFGHWIS
jgi:hypothetical protein